jgi:predicted SprT family Zn-dependent metalloprotease
MERNLVMTLLDDIKELDANRKPIQHKIYHVYWYRKGQRFAYLQTSWESLEKAIQQSFEFAVNNSEEDSYVYLCVFAYPPQKIPVKILKLTYQLEIPCRGLLSLPAFREGSKELLPQWLISFM